MDEPRRIVLVLGNGFDLDLGLKTSYKNFWESDFCPKSYPAPIIRHLNSKWGDNLESVRWYDLENELLQYALRNHKTDVVNQRELNYLKNRSEAQISQDVHFFGGRDEIASLAEKGFLTCASAPVFSVSIPYKADFNLSAIERDKKALHLIKEGLCNYLKTVTLPQDFRSTIAYQVITLIDNMVEKGDFVKIYTFNYTPLSLNGFGPENAKVHYLHGSYEDGRIIIGTRDDQFLNESYDFLQKSFDPFFNPPPLVEDLKEANEVIIFGHSIGENDRQYFKAFFKQQTESIRSNRKDITIFTSNDKSEIQIRRALQKMTDWNLSTLFGQNNLQIIKTNNLEEDKKLYKFLVNHGTIKSTAKDFIGKWREYLKRRTNA